MATRLVLCHEVLHDGDGPLGRSVEIPVGPRLPSQCAEAAARLFDEMDLADHNLDDSHFHDASRVIEVPHTVAGQRPYRYRVRCQVERHYTAKANGR